MTPCVPRQTGQAVRVRPVITAARNVARAVQE
jgi:hypothetical protein